MWLKFENLQFTAAYKERGALNALLLLSDEAKARGVHFVDAPLSRTPKEAEAGTLDTMVGAEPEVFARIEPVLRAWAGNVVHLGPVGLGHKMKLINNFVAMGYAALYSEAMAIARKAGLRYVYTGNVHDSEGGTTFCPTCQKALVVRDWYEISRYEISADGSCPGCGHAIAGRFGRYERPFGAHRIPVRIGVA